MKIYVASSWRNVYQPDVVAALREAGHEVYDFKNPAPGDNGFGWREISPNWQRWTAGEQIAALAHPAAQRGLKFDFDAMKWCDTLVMLQPCGRSAALELGWAIGAGKRTAVVMVDGQEPELMVRLADFLCTSIEAVIEWLREEVVESRGKVAVAESEVDQLRAIRDAMQSALDRPCPITGERFFMVVEHPERGPVATYGGPYDSYTVPVRDRDGEWHRERYDHDQGTWVEGTEHVEPDWERR